MLIVVHQTSYLQTMVVVERNQHPSMNGALFQLKFFPSRIVALSEQNGVSERSELTPF